MAGAALAVQVVLTLLLLLGVHLGGDGQHIVIHGQVDVLLLHTGQLCLQQVIVLLLLHIHAEARGADHVVHVEEGTEEPVVKGVVHGVADFPAGTERNDGIHKTASFNSLARSLS